MKIRNVCKHCNLDILIRNPSGFCDHLYYPDNCEICQILRKEKRPHAKEKSKIDEIKVKRDYAGTEASPYRDWRDKTGDYNQEHEAIEPPEANPDTVSEDKGLFYQNESSNYRLELIEKVAKTLTPKQREILRLCGNEGRTMENCAAILGISKGAVQSVIERIRRKVVALQKRGL